MKVFQAVAVVLVWLLGLPLVISVAISTAWDDTGGIDSGDAPSTGAAAFGWLLVLGGIGVLIAVTVALSRLGEGAGREEWSRRQPPEPDPWDRWKT